MLWIIVLGFLFMVCFIVCLLKDELSSDDGGIGIFFIGLIFFVVSFGMVINGVNVYPNLLKEREEILILQKEIKTIEEGHYSDVESGSFVGGSLDNQGQSKIYTEYLKNYAYKKSHFNGKLLMYQKKKRIRVFGWLEYYFFVSDKIYEIEKL